MSAPIKNVIPEECGEPYHVADVLLDEEKHIRSLLGKNVSVIDETPEGDSPAPILPTRVTDPQDDPRHVGPELIQYRIDRAQKELERYALCLSGGGIRSACISLGVIQGLADRTKLGQFHYLSTVSGGGYIGCWLSSWIKALRPKGKGGNAEKVEQLLPHADHGVEAAEIRNLRTNSNYLTPRIGALSVDLFACLMIVARNILVNWLILIPFFAFCLAVTMLILNLSSVGVDALGDAAWIPGLIAVACLVTNAAIAIKVMPIFQRARKNAGKFGAMSGEYLNLMRVRWALTLLAAFAMALWTHAVATLQSGFLLSLSDGNYSFYWPVYALFLLPYAFGFARAGNNNSDAAISGNTPFFGLRLFVSYLVASALSYSVARGLIAFLCPVPAVITHFFAPVQPLFHHTLYLTFVPALWVLVIEIQNFLMIGCLSMVTNDEDREWWSRSNGVTSLLALGWLAACLVTVCGPALSFLFIVHKTELLAALASQFTLGGIVAMLASSAKTPATTRDRPAPIRMSVLQGAAIVFFILLAMLIATANFKIAASLDPWAKPDISISVSGPVPAQPSTDDNYRVLPILATAPELAPSWAWFCLIILWGLLSLAASMMININQFSLQCLYRNRLLRCFVGAVRRAPAQAANAPPGAFAFEPFTGFDTTDNYNVADLRFQLPFHVINMAQNLIKTTNLAWQQRMAASFTVTPLYTGGEITGYRTTKNFGGSISIGTAMATSGAAANPSMGHCTSPILELIMGLFDARLGWWVGNPASEKKWREVGPSLALKPLFKEMFGQTSQDQDYVLLSDGGHFEDLAIYEMIQRRCRFLLVVDGGADPTGNFEDLGNAVRKVRIDLGVEIDFLFNRTTPVLAEKEDERQHFAVAKIVYSDTDGTKEEQDGWLLYIKCNLNGDESQDIYQYKQFYNDFPHQTTMDQWFDESQFESYRALGQHSLERTLDALRDYQSSHRMFSRSSFPGAITTDELGSRKAEFQAFLRFMQQRNFL